MSINVRNGDMPGIQFSRGMDVTSDMLTGMEQYISTELLARTKDFIKIPGFVYGFHVGAISGQDITITAGEAFDQLGRRLGQSTDRAYKVSFPDSGGNSGYLVVRASLADTAYKVHPYDGTRHPTESVVGLSITIETGSYTDSSGNRYPSDVNGLILAKLLVDGVSYTWDETGTNRSPALALQDGV